MSAPFGVSFSLTDDTTFGWEAIIEVIDADEEFPWATSRAEYSILNNCGGKVLALNSDTDNGLMIDAVNERVLCLLPDLRLRPGTYGHGLRFVDRDSGITFQAFDDGFTITQGNF